VGRKGDWETAWQGMGARRGPLQKGRGRHSHPSDSTSQALARCDESQALRPPSSRATGRLVNDAGPVCRAVFFSFCTGIWGRISGAGRYSVFGCLLSFHLACRDGCVCVVFYFYLGFTYPVFGCCEMLDGDLGVQKESRDSVNVEPLKGGTIEHNPRHFLKNLVTELFRTTWQVVNSVKKFSESVCQSRHVACH
jgi:hypothetical protein